MTKPRQPDGAVAAPAAVPTPPGHEPVIATADDFMSFVDALQGSDRVRSVFNTFAEQGEPALFWASLMQAQKEGMRELPAPMLRVLASVAAAVLAARTETDLRAAVGMPRPKKGGPGGAASMAANFSTKAKGDALWLEHARVTGEPLGDPPVRLAEGVLATVARRFGTTPGALQQSWRRYKAQGQRPDARPAVSLPNTFFGSSPIR